MDNKIINDDVRTTRIMLIILCIVFPIAPFIIIYLIATWNPTGTIDGQVNNKRSEMKTRSMWFGGISGSDYYITIGTKELNVSEKIYKMLKNGDFVSAAYRKHTLYYFW